MANVNLSKSRYTAYCQCPKNLWLGVYHPEVIDNDPATLARFEKGSEVGELAKRLFPSTIDVTTHNGEALDLKAMIEKTQQCIANGTEVIAEAAFSYEGCYCAVDLLRHEGDGWTIYEVKSTSNKEEGGKLKKFDKYLPDIAYQTWVLRQCGIKVTGINLVCLNRDYVRHGELNPQQLFAIIDMREAVEDELAKVPMQVPEALKVLKQEAEPNIDLSENCEKPYHCAFWNYCTRHLPEDSVFKVYGSSTGKGDATFHIDKKLEHYRAGRVSYEQLVDQPLGIIQRMQVKRQTHIDRDGIRRFLDRLTYPLYFLDFETMQDVIPQYDGTRPSMQITFQYSLHVVDSPDSICKKHGYGYLAPSDGSDPRRKLAEDLCRHIPMGVCTLAYNMSFEKGRISELAQVYPDLHDHLMDIHSHIIDLIEPFRAGYYYLPDMNGSFSIKSVLPALFPGDPDLDYHNLEGDVHNGTEAMTIFPKIKDMPPSEAAEARKSLLQYCNLDTWAMVKVWEKLMNCK
ncbi:MAG: DUF2779 domain-containing protein [Bacteroidales bacterium]|nr:DUF2779 domain-containing protein [Bacteroidales bacterium]